MVQERSKSQVRIEIWEIYCENPSLVEFQESSVHPPLSSALIRSSESSLFVTLGDRHHLDGSVVIGGTKTTQSSCGWLVSCLWVVLGDSPRWSVEESARREHLDLARIKGSKALARVLQRGLVESGDSPIPRKNIAEHFLALLLYFVQLLWAFTFLEFPCYRIGTRLQNFYPVAL